MVTRSGDWTVAVGTARGSTHVVNDRPNQDAHAIVAAAGATVVAVADGHGGDRYVRSDRGSRFAVDVATEAAARWWALRGAGLALDRASEALQAELVPEIVAAWRARVADDFEAQPASDEENVRAGADIGDDPLIAYGSTLLLAILAPDTVVIAQLGDGDVFCYGAGVVTSPLPDDERLVAGATTSLCTESATTDFRVVAVGGAGVELLVAATDGYGNSFADADWRDRVADDLARQLRGRDARSLDGSLTTWAAESADAGGDDVTVAVATHSPIPSTLGDDPTAPVAAVAPAGSPTAAPESTTTSAGAPGPIAAAGTRSGTTRARTPWVVAILAGIVGLGAGAAIGVMSSGDDAAAPAQTASVETTSTTIGSSPQQTPRTQLVSDADTVVEFSADQDDPQPTFAQAALGTVSWFTAMELEGGAQWQITEAGDIRARDSAAGGWRNVDVRGLDASSLTYEADHVWAVAQGDGGTYLIRIDPGTRSAQDWRISPTGAAPDQKPTTDQGAGPVGAGPGSGTQT